MINQLNQLKLEIESKQLEVSKLIRDTKTKFDEKAQEVRTNRHLSAEGRAAEFDKIRTELETELTDKFNKIKEEHDRAAKKAVEVANKILAQSKHDKPSDDQIALFERDLRDLKTKLVLTPSYQRALELVNDFTSKYQDAYYTAKLLDEYQDIIESILPLAQKTDEAKLTLTRMYNTLSERAKTEEQRAAEHYLQYHSNPQLLNQAGIDHQLLVDLFGAVTAYRLTR